jgi:hypothetical protein
MAATLDELQLDLRQVQGALADLASTADEQAQSQSSSASMAGLGFIAVIGIVAWMILK